MAKHLTPDELRELVPLLGTMTDCTLAKRFDVSNSTIAYHRAKADVPPLVRGPLAPWRAQFGIMTDLAIAQAAGVSRSAVGRLRLRLKGAQSGNKE